ncbi:MAG TPA: AbrB/MazE/SpoVT family DNA-binding domain-containing protein [Bacillales bacterium]|nr:AbrB/MazE/SpoVT family DNA-binding domain-containing protein [Bacillales bacterium]
MTRLERKVTKIGRSYGVTIPIEMLREHGIEPGDYVNVKSVDGMISISKSRKVDLPEGISPDFFEVLERNTKKHHETFHGLKDR